LQALACFGGFAGCLVFFSGGVAFVVAVAVGEKVASPEISALVPLQSPRKILRLGILIFLIKCLTGISPM
jgi:hypothetical protein